MSNDEPYDESSLLTDYIWKYGTAHMTKEELLCQSAIFSQIKAEQTERIKLKTWHLQRVNIAENPIVAQALENGIEAFRINLRDRILREHPEIVKYCPQCHRLLRTPTAKQCRWCHHSWHESSA